MPDTYLIIAGEESADNHGAELMKSMINQDSGIKFFGIGGRKMMDSGLISIENIEKMAVMGFIEIIRYISFFRNLMKRVLTKIDEYKPRQIILIDYPGFNLRLAQRIKNQFNIPITYYISPQIWAWKEKRIDIIKKYIDQMLVIFPFEENWYNERGIDAKFVGHPIYNEWVPSSRKDLCRLLGKNYSKPIITLFPGSRKQEVKRHLPILLDTSGKLKRKNKDIQFILGVANHINIENLDIPDWVHIEKQFPQKALECANLALIASGTSTIEAAVFGTPMVIIYKMSPLSWFISKKLVRVPYAGMVNIIAGSMIMPEILQYSATPTRIYNTALEIINNPEKINQMESDLLIVKNSLKSSKNSKTATDYILELK